jgi:hypothetical protein
VSETTARTSYELFVGRHVSPATLATFPVALVPTAVPRNTVRRLRVDADSDLADIVRRLTERDVELLEIRRCPDRVAPPDGRVDPPIRLDQWRAARSWRNGWARPHRGARH